MIPRKILPCCALKNREKWIFMLKNSQKISFSKIKIFSRGFHAESPPPIDFSGPKTGVYVVFKIILIF